MLIHYQMLLPILIHASPNLIHALPILIHWLGFLFSAPNLIHWTDTTRLGSQSESSTREPLALDSQSESSITSPESSANQNRAPSALGSQSESSITSPEWSANQNRALRHPRCLGSGGGPFSALGSSRLAIAYLNTWGPPPTWSAHSSTTDYSSCVFHWPFQFAWK